MHTSSHQTLVHLYFSDHQIEPKYSSQQIVPTYK